VKRRTAAKHGLQGFLRNSEIARHCTSRELREKLVKRKGKSISGICVIAIMVRPSSCPYHCAYCPTSEIAAKSYTGHEPAALRARQNDFDAGRQVNARIRQLEANGHNPNKNELIVMGGTFNVQPLEYKREFLKSAYDAFNGMPSTTLEEAIIANETAPRRVIGLTFETRPDCASREQLSELLEWGATRIEFGVQSLDEEALVKAKRGHTTLAVREATANAKDAFLKVGYHLMPGLFSTPDKDVEMFKEIFTNPAYRPDMLKIYPTLVIPGTELHELWLRGEYAPYTNEEAAQTIAQMLKDCPRYVRVMRVDRDIPTHQIAAGVKKTNLREMVDCIMLENGWKCNDIRAREMGLRQLKGTADEGKLELSRIDYEASGGLETFLGYETRDGTLAGYLRLRKPGKARWRSEAAGETTGIRELRVLGKQVAVGERGEGVLQHKNIGKRLVETALDISRNEWGAKKVLVISGVGVREYYRKLGFKHDGPYLSRHA